MRNRQEIIDYLGLEMSSEYVGKDGLAFNEKCIETAKRIEKKYAEELKSDDFGYALTSDVVCTPTRFINKGERLVVVKEYKYASVYKIVRD